MSRRSISIAVDAGHEGRCEAVGDGMLEIGIVVPSESESDRYVTLHYGKDAEDEIIVLEFADALDMANFITQESGRWKGGHWKFVPHQQEEEA